MKREPSHTSSCAQCAHARYSASQDERATMACCLELQAIGALAHLMIKPEIDCLPSDMAQSESAKAWNKGNGFGVLP